MKPRLFLLLTTFIFFFGCKEIKSSENEVSQYPFNGSFDMTGLGNHNLFFGLWVFSNDEIAILDSEDKHRPYSNIKFVGVQKYYIEDKIIYTCKSTTNDCQNKKAFEKTWIIDSVEKTNSKLTIILKSPSYDRDNISIKLEKSKSLGLDVNDWE